MAYQVECMRFYCCSTEKFYPCRIFTHALKHKKIVATGLEVLRKSALWKAMHRCMIVIQSVRRYRERTVVDSHFQLDVSLHFFQFVIRERSN